MLDVIQSEEFFIKILEQWSQCLRKGFTCKQLCSLHCSVESSGQSRTKAHNVFHLFTVGLKSEFYEYLNVWNFPLAMQTCWERWSYFYLNSSPAFISFKQPFFLFHKSFFKIDTIDIWINPPCPLGVRLKSFNVAKQNKDKISWWSCRTVTDRSVIINGLNKLLKLQALIRRGSSALRISYFLYSTCGITPSYTLMFICIHLVVRKHKAISDDFSEQQCSVHLRSADAILRSQLVIVSEICLIVPVFLSCWKGEVFLGFFTRVHFVLMVLWSSMETNVR